MDCVHIPIVPGQFQEGEVRDFQKALAEGGGCVLAHCKAGGVPSSVMTRCCALSPSGPWGRIGQAEALACVAAKLGPASLMNAPIAARCSVKPSTNRLTFNGMKRFDG